MESKDYSGLRIGMLTVLEKLPCIAPKYYSYYLCRCDCGAVVTRPKDSILAAVRESRQASCGCLVGGTLNKGKLKPASAKSKIGQKLHRLTIIGICETAFVNRRKGYKMKCLCECGNYTVQVYADLKNGKVRSCGCYGREQQSLTGSTVGISNGNKACNRFKWHSFNNGKRIRMRSGYEVMYANALDSMGVQWLYEPECFKLQEGLRYTPDFYLPQTNEWIEVKGKLSEISKRKHDLFRV